jgi:hypothetical protein
MKNMDTLSEAINMLKAKGYVNDFNLHPDWIECPVLNIKFKPEEFHVDEMHRFEGMSNPDDNAVLFAISSSDGQKGLLVDAYGVYSDSLSKLMIDKLRIDGETKAKY